MLFLIFSFALIQEKIKFSPSQKAVVKMFFSSPQDTVMKIKSNFLSHMVGDKVLFILPLEWSGKNKVLFSQKTAVKIESFVFALPHVVHRRKTDDRN